MHFQQITIVVEPDTLPEDIPEGASTPAREYFQIDRFAAELSALAQVPVGVIDAPLHDAPAAGLVIFVPGNDVAESLAACPAKMRASLPARTVLFAIDRSEIFYVLEQFRFAAAIEVYPAFIWRSGENASIKHANALHGLTTVAERMGAETHQVRERYCLLRHDPFPGLPKLLVEYLQHYQPEDLQRAP